MAHDLYRDGHDRKPATGFLLKRIADYVIATYLPGSGVIGMAVGAAPEQLRAAVIDELLGVPRGLWVMAGDQIQDVKTLAFDLPRALINFFCEDPAFALAGAPRVAVCSPLDGAAPAPYPSAA